MASTIPKQSLRGGSKGTALRPWQRPYRRCPFVLWPHGGKGRVLTLWGKESGQLNNKYGVGYYLHLWLCLAETTVSSGHAAPFNIGSKHVECGDNREHLVVMYDTSSYDGILSANRLPNHGVRSPLCHPRQVTPPVARPEALVPP